MYTTTLIKHRFDNIITSKIHYLPLTDSSVCVDDVKSSYYNKIIDSSMIVKKDWLSAEQMREIPVYQFGAVIQHNTNPTLPGAGSCIICIYGATQQQVQQVA